jgi:hypothetical protein
MPRGNSRTSCLVVHNGDNDPDHDDDEHVHRWQPNNPHFPYSYSSTKAHHIQATQCMGDGKPMSP